MFRNLSPGAIGVDRNALDIMKAAKSSGFGGIDPDFGPLTQGESPEAFIVRHQEAGLKIGGWGLPVSTYGTDEERAPALEALPDLAKMAASVGSTRCSTWLLPYSDTRRFEENFDFHVSRLQPSAKILADHGCRLGLEFIGPKTFRAGKAHEFIHTQDGMLKLASAIGPNVGLLFDAWHWYTSHGTLEDIARLTDDDIICVHINDAPKGKQIDEQIDNVREIPGDTGVIDLVGFLRALNNLGYTGPVTPEPFSAKLKELAPQRAVKVVGQSFEQVWVKALGVR